MCLSICQMSEMDGACSPYGGEERRVECFGGGNLKERDNLEDISVNGRKY
jgi:hypothetical protein